MPETVQLMAPHDTAVARVEVQVAALASALERLSGEVSQVRSKLDQAHGAAVVLRWFGFGSLASVLAVLATLGAWMHGSAR